MNDVVKVLVGVFLLNALTILILTAYIKTRLNEMYEVIVSYSKLSYEAIEGEKQELDSFKEKEKQFFKIALSFIEASKEKLNEKTEVSEASNDNG